MPVTTSIPICHFRLDDFGKVAYEVVGYAFRIHKSREKAFHESFNPPTDFGERSVEQMRRWQKDVSQTILKNQSAAED